MKKSELDGWRYVCACFFVLGLAIGIIIGSLA
jgi:hypothetical protein